MPRTYSPLLALLLLSGPWSSLLAQGVLLEKRGAQAEDHFASAIENIGDLDFDGVDDLLVSSTCRDDPQRAGMVQAISGRNGTVLYSAVSMNQREMFGHALCRAADLNGDGLPEFAVGAPELGGSGRALFLSGADGSVLWSYSPPNPGEYCGSAVDARADVDGDSVVDVLVGGADSDGAVRLLSGSTGAVLREELGTASEHLGYCVRYVGDIDLDGVVDYAASAPFAMPYGVLRYYSGATGRLIREVSSDMYFIWGVYAQSLADLGDVNLDGHPDLAVPTRGLHNTKIETLSGYDGLPLYEVQGLLVGSLIATPDLDQDGVLDLLAPTFGDNEPAVLSGRTGSWLHTSHTRGVDDLYYWTHESAAVLDQNLDGVLDYALGSSRASDGSGFHVGRLLVFNGRCGSVESYSEPCGKDWLIEPGLFVNGLILGGESVTLRVLAPLAPSVFHIGLLVVGIKEADLPIGNGCSLRVRPGLIQPFALDYDSNSRVFTADIPGRIPAGVGPSSLYCQVVLGSASSPILTNAVRIEIP